VSNKIPSYFHSMKVYQPWSENLWNQLRASLKEAQSDAAHSKQKLVSAFDADGTLWDTDLGEAFFKHQIAHCALPGLPAKPWEFYRHGKETADPRPAYWWLAQINQGQSLAQVRSWATQAVEKNSPLPVFEDSRKWIAELREQNVEVYIVTASVKWAVEAGAHLLGLDFDHVIGVETKVVDGLVTDQPFSEMTYKAGKVTALLKKTGGRKPFFACGNSTGDTALLQSATHAALAVGAATEDHELWDTESQLRRDAEANKWLYHHY
jgi:phosphoserine phosphatase